MFKPKPILDPDEQDWHVACWAWLLRHGEGRQRLIDTPLVLPNEDFFPGLSSGTDDLAERLFDRVKQLADMEDWPTRLVAQDERPDQLSPTTHLVHSGQAAGSFTPTGNTAEISYDPKHIKAPVTLVATFAHELAHYLNGGFPEHPPGGVDFNEPATDVTAIYLGFGLFGANSTFTFSQVTNFDSQGWSRQSLGYLSEAEWAFGLAMFCVLGEKPVDALKPRLKPHIWRDVQRAARQISEERLDAQALSAADRFGPT